jgi:polyhydroxybutyrate depolymerase
MVGVSMGAIMTFHALTELDNRIAAVSCHIGTMSTQDITNYNPTFAIPVQQIHGTNDQTVPYDGTPLQTLSLVPETLTKLKAVNGWVAGDSTITNIPNLANDGITIEKIEYNCANADLEHWKMNGADHIFLFQPTNDTSGIFVSWYFLRKYSHPNPIPLGTYQSKPNDFKVEFYPNPASQTINITNSSNLKSINIYSMNGQLIMSETINNQININQLSKGMYVIEFVNTADDIFKDKLIIE